MFSMSLTSEMLSPSERAMFSSDLARHGVDDAIWEVYGCLMKVSSRTTQPLVLRVLDGNRLAGAAFVIRCKAWGRAVFDHPLLRKPFDLVGLPSLIWIRVGYCAEGAANPGFVAEGFDRDEVVVAMINYLQGCSYGLIVTDRTADERFHTNTPTFPYVADGAVCVEGMTCVQDYLDQHNNIKRKIKSFTNKGGRVDVRTGPFDTTMLETVRRCIDATVGKSLVYSPFQDIFLDVVMETCRCPSDRIVHFVATMKDEVLGYHTFVRTGSVLRMIHGGFDREKKTTHHAYENLIIATVQHALEQGLNTVYFGPIMNETKRRMMNTVDKSSLHFYGGCMLTRVFFPMLFPYTKMQQRKLLVYR